MNVYVLFICACVFAFVKLLTLTELFIDTTSFCDYISNLWYNVDDDDDDNDVS